MFATINELIFPVFLFAVYFCTASIVFYDSKPSNRSRQDVVAPEQEENVEIELTAQNISQEVKPKPPVKTSSLEPVVSAPIQMSVPQVADPSLVETQSSKELHAQADRIISHLNKRQSRKLCQPLGIQQKHGKVEKTLSFIKAEIRSLFKDNPERVIAVIQEKLPELISPVPEVGEPESRIAS